MPRCRATGARERAMDEPLARRRWNTFLIRCSHYGLYCCSPATASITPGRSRQTCRKPRVSRFTMRAHPSVKRRRPVRRQVTLRCRTTAICARWTMGEPGSSIGGDVADPALPPARWRCRSAIDHAGEKHCDAGSFVFGRVRRGSGSAGTPTSSSIMVCHPDAATPCCANTSRRCGRCGPKRRPATASSSVRTLTGPGPSRCNRTSGAGRRCGDGNLQVDQRAQRRRRITTPRRRHRRAVKCRKTSGRRRRDGLSRRSWPDVKPVPDKLALGREAALRRCCWYADRSADIAAAYVERLAAKLAYCV